LLICAALEKSFIREHLDLAHLQKASQIVWGANGIFRGA